MLCTTGMWIDVYSVSIFALLVSLRSWILQIPETMWAMHVRCVWPMWTHFFDQFWICNLDYEPLEYVILYDGSSCAIDDEVVTSSIAEAQHGQGRASHSPTMLCKGIFLTAGLWPPYWHLESEECVQCRQQLCLLGTFSFFLFILVSPDNSRCPGGSVQTQIQTQRDRALSFWSLSPAQTFHRTWEDDVH